MKATITPTTPTTAHVGNELGQEREEEGERRHDVRIDVRAAAAAAPVAYILRRGEKEQVEVVNASYRGVFLRLTGEAPPPQQLMKLQIQLPTRSIVVHAIPVRIVVDGTGRAGVGARFFALNGELRQVWDTFIGSLLAHRRPAAA